MDRWTGPPVRHLLGFPGDWKPYLQPGSVRPSSRFTMKPKIISLRTRAGRLDLGLEAAGHESLVCVEMDGEAVAATDHLYGDS